MALKSSRSQYRLSLQLTLSLQTTNLGGVTLLFASINNGLTPWWTYSAAAILLILGSTSTWLFWRRERRPARFSRLRQIAMYMREENPHLPFHMARDAFTTQRFKMARMGLP
jgi:hypothetical protein